MTHSPSQTVSSPHQAPSRFRHIHALRSHHHPAFQLARYALNCGFVLGAKLLLLSMLLHVMSELPAYFIVHLLIFFISYAIHSKITFRQQMSARQCMRYLGVVLQFKIADYLIFSVAFAGFGMKASWSVILATTLVMAVKFVWVRKALDKAPIPLE